MNAPTITRIVLTGGPCAGKSSAMIRVHAHLEAHGLRVYRAPEASTLLLSGGIVVKNAPLAQLVGFQRGIVRVQLALESAFEAFAQAVGRPAVLLCDRGVLDGAAYLPRDAWEQLLREEGIDEAELRERRYLAVIHLVSAAFGAEGAYDTLSNSVRFEDVEGARKVDLRLREAWDGHPRLRVIDNASDFDAKLRRVVNAVSDILGVPAPAE